MRVRLLAQVSGLVFCLASAAHAATVEFIHSGHPVSLGGVLDGEADPIAEGAQPGMSGTVLIESDHYGSGKTAGTTLWITSIATNEFGNIDPDGDVNFGYEITGESGLIDVGDGFTSLINIPFMMGVTGQISQFFAPGAVGPNSVRLDFDENGDIAYWVGHNTDGGSDPYWGVSGAGFSSVDACAPGGYDLCTNIGGTWETVVHSGQYPSPVPLPLSASLLLGGLALLPVARWLRPHAV
ncbi:MAG: hypothetical protein AAF714_08465 [Pseudomonadota bacterium]